MEKVLKENQASQEGKALFALLRSAMTGQALPAADSLLEEEGLSRLFSLAQTHDLAHLLAEGLQINGLLDREGEVKPFSQARFKAVYRYEQLRYEYDEIYRLLQTEGIPFIPLKGAVLRDYYPKPWLRTSCDIDILVKEEDLERGIAALQKEGYELKERAYHDVSLFAPSGVHLELHFSLLESQEKLDRVLKKAWSYAEQKEGSAYAFTKEFFLFYTFAHAAYHFLSGGCGLRVLLDIWVIKEKMGGEYLAAKDLLEEAGIFTFAKELDALCDYCFADGKETPLARPMLRYIVSGGTYGTVENKVAIQRGESHSTVAYVFKRLFPPYRVMKEYYKVLRKAPILLPFCWIARWVRGIFGGKGGRAIKEIKTARKTSKETGEDLQALCNQLGLQP